MAYKIAIVGLGKIGLRHLESLAKHSGSWEIFACDSSDDALHLAKREWQSWGNLAHKMHFIQSLSGGIQNIDVLIVATAANKRVELVRDILQFTKVKYWVLEKILAQSPSQLYDIYTMLKDAKGAWVHSPRPAWKLYQNFKRMIQSGSPIKIEIVDLEGLATNAIHFISLMEFLTNSKVNLISTENLQKNWFESKRSGYFEIFGELQVEFEDGSMLSIKSAIPPEYHHKISIYALNLTWSVDEFNQVISNNFGEIIEGNLELVSCNSAKYVDQIIKTANSDLPSLNKSIDGNAIFLEALIKHWNVSMDAKIDEIPIT